MKLGGLFQIKSGKQHPSYSVLKHMVSLNWPLWKHSDYPVSQKTLSRVLTAALTTALGLFWIQLLVSPLKSVRYTIKSPLKLVLFSKTGIQDNKEYIADTFRMSAYPAHNTLHFGNCIPISHLDATFLWPCPWVTGPHEDMRSFLIQDSHVLSSQDFEIGIQ